MLTPTPSAGRYPTPVVRLKTDRPDGELWVKNDGLTSPIYGGNKVRKLDRILPRALARGARRLVTFGAAGSHHALATSVFGRAVGVEVLVVLWPQPRTAHALDTLRAIASSGATIAPVRNAALAAPAALARFRPGDYWLAPGAMSTEATRAYIDAVGELAGQITNGELPEPAALVVALGTGGTAAGLLAGVVAHGLMSRVVGVAISAAPGLRALVLAQAATALRSLGRQADVRSLSRRLVVDAAELGGGYGYPTDRGARAAIWARRSGLLLDPTYTAKACASALGRTGHWGFPRDSPNIRVAPAGPTLYWHTLSAASAPHSTGEPRGAIPALESELFPR